MSEQFIFNKDFFVEISEIFRTIQINRIKDFVEDDYYENSNEKNNIINKYRINRLFNYKLKTMHFCCNQMENDFLIPIIKHLTLSNYIQKFFSYKIDYNGMQTYAIIVIIYLYYALSLNEQTDDFLYISDFMSILGAHKYKIVTNIINSFYIGSVENEDKVISEIRRMILGLK